MKNKTIIQRYLQGVFWILIYILIATAPLVILLAGPRPAGREFWRDLSVGLGYCGLSMVGLQFVLTSRFKSIKAPYGSDIVYFFHRQISIVAFLLIASHPILLFIFEPSYLSFLNLATAPTAARLGVISLCSMAVLIGISIWRKNLRIEYDRWRIWHGILAIAAMVLAFLHVELRAYYLNAFWKQVFWGIYALAWVGLLIWIRIIKPLILMKKAYRIEKVVPEGGGAWTLVLRPEGHTSFRFQPGQFAWITVRDSPFSDHEHPFSISSSAEKIETISFTIKELGDFTSRIKELSPGERVYVDGPFGAFSSDRHPLARKFVFIAGGIGITPMISMLRTLADRGDQRPLTLIYANRTYEGITFLDEIGDLSQRLNLKVVHVVQRPPGDWHGESGFVNADILGRHLPAERESNAVEIFICGPGPMMDAVETALVSLGVPVGDFHSERFDLV